MRRQLLIFVLLMLLTIVVGYLAGCATGGGQPHMNAALDELRAARQELEVAATDKGGHRERAIGLVDQAISEVQAGIAYAAR